MPLLGDKLVGVLRRGRLDLEPGPGAGQSRRRPHGLARCPARIFLSSAAICSRSAVRSPTRPNKTWRSGAGTLCGSTSSATSPLTCRGPPAFARGRLWAATAAPELGHRPTPHGDRLGALRDQPLAHSMHRRHRLVGFAPIPGSSPGTTKRIDGRPAAWRIASAHGSGPRPARGQVPAGGINPTS